MEKNHNPKERDEFSENYLNEMGLNDSYDDSGYSVRQLVWNRDCTLNY